MFATISFSPAKDSTVSSPLSLWQVRVDNADNSQAESFSAPGYAGEELAVWSFDLPAGSATSYYLLAEQTVLMTQRQVATAKIGQYLQQSADPMYEAQSFAVEQSSKQLAEEKELWQRLQQIRRGNNVSYSILPEITGVDKITKEFQQFMSQTAYVLRPTMQVNSEHGKTLFAQTIIHAAGNAETCWQQHVGVTQKKLHQETVKMVMETRHAVLSFLSHVLSGVAALAIKFSITSILALPSVFRFVYDVIRRAKEDQLLARVQQISVV